MPPPPTLTPAQLAKQAERKAAKLAKKAANPNASATHTAAEAEKRRILKREWTKVSDATGQRSARIGSWNMLAQTLVRRELFPGSDCLKWGDRKPMLHAEMEQLGDLDIICLQEVDRLDFVRTGVPQYEVVQATGVGKLHGLVVLYKSAKYNVHFQQAVSLDEELLSPKAEGEVAQRGVSRRTRNMGLIVALKEKGKESGIVIVTTHLFWHPKFEYERTRQLIVLLRAMQRLQKEHGCEDWPAIFAGDLNTQPAETTYQLLAAPSNPVPPQFLKRFENSRLVHSSVAQVPSSAVASTAASGAATPEAEKDDEKEEDELPDSHEESIAGTRPAREEDGIRSLEDLVGMMKEVLPEPARSAYGISKWEGETYASRDGFLPGVKAVGGGEPAYTCFTPLFKLTLDYIFALPGKARVEFTQLLQPPKAEQLGAGLPRKGVSASDHIAVACEIVW